MNEESALEDPPTTRPGLGGRPWYLGSLLIGSALLMGSLQHPWNDAPPRLTVPGAAAPLALADDVPAAVLDAPIAPSGDPTINPTINPTGDPTQTPAAAARPAEPQTPSPAADSLFDRSLAEHGWSTPASRVDSPVAAPATTASTAPLGLSARPADPVDADPVNGVATNATERPPVPLPQPVDPPLPTVSMDADAATHPMATAEPAPAAAAELAAAVAPTPPVPEPLEPPPVEPPAVAPKPSTFQLTIQPGDTLASRFERLGIPAADLALLLEAPGTRAELSFLRSGEALTIRVAPDQALLGLIYHTRDGAILRAERTEHGFDSQLEQPPPAPVETVLVEGRIDSSFYNAARLAGLSSSMRMQVSSMLAPVVDFSRQLRKGDSFKVLLEQSTDEFGNRKQRLLAAELTNRGKVHRAVRYKTAAGTISAFTPAGESLGVGFARYPLKFTRISSRFNHRRWHPKLHRVRPHTGVDFAAPVGTPIKAPGDGRVSFYGRKSGYGRVLEVEHGRRYKTVYAHLSRFARGLHKGSRVHKGQTIAFVGQSGMATGPHLHYEFHIDGKPVNPLSARLPSGFSLPDQEREDFKAYAAGIIAQLEGHSAVDEILVASGDHGEANDRL